jgi:DTW domain-containing protein YfiP
MHPKEAKQIRNNTGRLAHLALKHSEILTGVDFTDSTEINALLADRSYSFLILYPGKTSKEISEIPPDELTENGKNLLVFVIDGTWKSAKKMMKMSRNLHGLPRVFIRPGRLSRFVIKHQPNSLCLSTIESIYYLLGELEKKGLENLEGRQKTLTEVLDRMVKIQLSYIDDSTPGDNRRNRSFPSRVKPRSKKPHKLFPFFR